MSTMPGMSASQNIENKALAAAEDKAAKAAEDKAAKAADAEKPGMKSITISHPVPRVMTGIEGEGDEHPVGDAVAVPVEVANYLVRAGLAQHA